MLKKIVRKTLNSMGVDIVKIRKKPKVRIPVEIGREEQEIVSHIQKNKLSMVSQERLWATLMACKHVINNNIDGDFVECGVWRGGNSLLAASIFRMYGSDKRVYLFDTFAGMTEPTEEDKRIFKEQSVMDVFKESQRGSYNDWCYASIEDVQNSFLQSGLLTEGVRFIKGDVGQTLEVSDNIPEKISVLRLDTDFYESTKKELEVLYPRLSVGGVLIIDDYGTWAGSKKATDEYFANAGKRPFLQYTDRTGRAAVKFE